MKSVSLFLWILLFSSSYCYAGIFDIPLKEPSVYHIQYSNDENDNNDILLSADIATEENNHVILLLQQANSNDPATSESDLIKLAFSSEYYADSNTAMSLSQYQTSSDLSIKTIDITFSFNLAASKISITPEHRNIRLYTVESSTRRYFDTSSRSYTLAFELNILENWLLLASYKKSGYSRDLTRLALNPDNFYFLYYLLNNHLSLNTLSQAYNLEESITTAGIRRYTSWGDWGVSVQESVSAVDFSTSQSTTITSTFIITNNTNIFFSGGVLSQESIDSSTQFFALGFSYSY